MKDYDPITAPIAEGDFNGPHGENPSEAHSKAHDIVDELDENIDYPDELVGDIERALQELADERDLARSTWAHWKERAETAEAHAEKVGQHLTLLVASEEAWCARAQKAEARLAELVNELVDWMELPANCNSDWEKFLSILMKYEEAEKCEGGEHG